MINLRLLTDVINVLGLSKSLLLDFDMCGAAFESRNDLVGSGTRFAILLNLALKRIVIRMLVHEVLRLILKNLSHALAT